jgi:trimeric autotransporter adhesin
MKSYFITWVQQLCFCLVFATSVNGQVSGTVYRDFNSNGVKNNTATFNEPFLSGITVKAYDATGVEVGSTTTSSTGTYSFTGLTLPLRIEFSGYGTGDYSGPNGTGNASSVQFYSAATTTANFGVNYPGDYCQATPTMATACYVSGNPLGGGTAGTDDVLVSFLYSNSGIGVSELTPFGFPPTAPAPTHGAFGNQIGSTWGEAYQRSKKRLFVSAFIKRHVGVGPLGEGGIYILDYSSGSAVVSNFVDVNTIGINTGTVGTGATPALRNISRGLNASKTGLTSAVADVAAFDAVGKKGIGDIDISDDETTLWLINLNDGTLNSIIIDSDNNPATAPTAADVQTFSLPANPCSAGALRPFAVKYYKGTVYVGAVCDGSLQAFMYSFNGSAFTPVLVNGVASVPLNYNKGQATVSGTCAAAVNDGWFTWTTTPPAACDGEGTASKLYAHPTPILCDIEFDVDGSIIISFIDRSGHQYGADNTQYDGSGLENVHSAGEILRICNVSGAFVMQGSAGCANNAANSEGPGGGEFYHQDFLNFPAGGGLLHFETTVGGMALQSGKGEVAVTCYDPFATAFLTGGINWFNNTTGLARNPGYVIYFGTNGAGGFGGGGNFSKAAGLGDLELLCDAAPIEIGNRIWMDTDNDGIQDAGEMGIGSIPVKLYLSGVQVGATTTAPDGTFYFNNSNVNLNGATGLLPNTAYVIRVDAADFPAGNSLSANQNVGGAGQPDVRDNDAALNGGNAEIAVTTGNYGENNHTLDMALIACSITNPSAAQSVCEGAAGMPLSVSTSATTGTIRFVYFTSAQTVAATIYSGGIQIGDVAPAAGTATLAYNWSAIAPGTYYVYAILNPDQGANCRPYQEIVVTIVDKPDLTANNLAICESAAGAGATVNLVSLVQNPDGVTLVFTEGSNPVVQPLAAGVHSINVTGTSPSLAGCSMTITFTITVSTPPALVVANGTVCLGSSIDLATLVTNAGSGSLSYYTTLANANAGTNALASSTVTPASATNYYVRSRTAAGCYTVKEVTVTLQASVCGAITITGSN